MFVLCLEGCCRDVRLVGIGAFLGRHGVVDAARAAAICNMVVINDSVVHHDGMVDIGVVNDRSVYTHDVGVIGESTAPPFTAREADTHIPEAVVDASVV